MQPILAKIPFVGRAARNQPARECLFCKAAVNQWQPYRIRTSDLSDFLRSVEWVTSHFERFGCPHCGCFDRERHLYMYLQRIGALDRIKGASVLHVAPEPKFGEIVRACGPQQYVAADLDGTSGIQRLDLQEVPYPDASFDMLICNHVLEHVADAAKAMHEMHRVLKPGGRAVCQTPFATRLTRTLEEPLLQNEADRLFFYGQEDHVRLFGRNIEDMLRAAGFTGGLRSHMEVLPDIDPDYWGVNEYEPLFDFVRDPAR